MSISLKFTALLWRMTWKLASICSSKRTHIFLEFLLIIRLTEINFSLSTYMLKNNPINTYFPGAAFIGILCNDVSVETYFLHLTKCVHIQWRVVIFSLKIGLPQSLISRKFQDKWIDTGAWLKKNRFIIFIYCLKQNLSKVSVYELMSIQAEGYS